MKQSKVVPLLAFAPVALHSIGKELDRLFREARGQVGMVRPGDANKLVLSSAQEQERMLHARLAAISEAQPGRLFVVRTDIRVDGIKAAVSASCYQLGHGESVCAEIIMLTVGPDALPAVPSVVRAFSLVGGALEIVLTDSGSTEAAEFLLPLADSLVLDSRTVAAAAFLPYWHTFDRTLFDLQWLRLQPWRSAVREAFDRPEVRPLTNSVNRLLVKGRGDSTSPFPTAPHVVAGWLASCLGAEAANWTGSLFELKSASGRTISLDIAFLPTSQNELEEIRIGFEHDSREVLVQQSEMAVVTKWPEGCERQGAPEQEAATFLAEYYRSPPAVAVSYNNALRKAATLVEMQRESQLSFTQL